MTPFKFFSERVDEAMKLDPMRAIEAIDALVIQAKTDKLDGYGPPQSEIDDAERRAIRLASELRRSRRAA